MFRQGDVLIVPVSRNAITGNRTTVPRDNGRVVLAYGEVTGHAHAIADLGAELIRLENGEEFLLTENGVSLKHEEHGIIPLSKDTWIDPDQGTYRIVHQREYTPQGLRNVQD